jgi:gas vesicle protein
MGYIRGLTHGLIVGAVGGVLFAPRAGEQTRQRVSMWIEQALGAVEDSAEGNGRSGQRARSRAAVPSTGRSED